VAAEARKSIAHQAAAHRRDRRSTSSNRLTAAEGLERFLHTKYVGQKRFSLEGGESFIASMDELIHQAGAKGVQEIVIGMAHRGRLNVLVNSLGKMPADLFAEFDHTAPEDLPTGDVKYHQGFSSDVTTPGGPVHLSAGVQPLAPRDRQPRGRRLRARPHGPPRRPARASRCCPCSCTATPPSPARAS
jgi:2-oxoglutarate dehydrogenase complex dehydrogenase (E1) component-like enzyme